MTAIADGKEHLVASMGDAVEEIKAEEFIGLFRVLDAIQILSPPELIQRRCQKCNKLLGRAEKYAHLEIKCPRCGHMATFP